MLINSSYFIGERNIPNTDRAEVLSLLDSFIEKYEKDYLLKAFGYELQKAFDEALLLPTVPQRFKDLLYGIDFTDNHDVFQKWPGLTPKTGTSPDEVFVYESPIADYIYYHFLKFSATETTGIGEVKPAAQNAMAESSQHKMVQAWNDMALKTKLLWEWLSNSGDYPEFKNYYFTKDACQLVTFKNRYQ